MENCRVSFSLETDDSPADAQRAARLRSMKLVSLSLLVVAAVVYALSVRLDQAGPWGFVTAASEAAMVGGLADWFAVTALFRHPLGLPIPHTAIIPRKKDDVAGMLQDFLTENFLTPDIVTDRLLDAHPAARTGRWLSDATHARRVVAEASKIAQTALGRVDADEVRQLAAGTLLPRLASEEVAPLAGRLLHQVVDDRQHVPLVDLVVNVTGQWLLANPARFEDLVGSKAPAWAPSFVNERVASWSYQQAVEWLVEVRNTPDHAARRALDDLLARLADDLQHDAAVRRRVEQIKEKLLAHPATASLIESVWGVLARSLDDALQETDSPLRAGVERRVLALGQRLASDEGWQRRADEAAAAAVSWLVTRYGRELTTVISHTIKTWDGSQAARTIELHVGRDLQFIRINGTVVGAIAGLLIHTFTVLVA